MGVDRVSPGWPHSLIGQHVQSGWGFFTVSPESGDVTTSRIPAELPVRGAGAEGTRVTRFHWNPTGDALFVEAIVNEVRNVWKVKVEPHTLAWLSAERLTTDMGADVAAALSSDAARLLFTTQRRSMQVWVFPFDAVAGRVMGEGRPVSPEDAEVSDAADLSPDGRAVVYQMTRAGSDRRDLWLTQIDSGKSELFAHNAWNPCWSPDGRMLAYNLFRPLRPPQVELTLAVRVLGGAEDIRGRWSSQEWLSPHDWTRDGRAILLAYQYPFWTGRAHLELRPADNAGAAAPGRVLVKDSHLKSGAVATHQTDGGLASLPHRVTRVRSSN
jgi:WD40-like Beta Propeller Repeat